MTLDVKVLEPLQGNEDHLRCEEEYPNLIKGPEPQIIRLYVSEDPESNLHFHFGFPKGLIGPLTKYLAIPMYWGRVPWAEHNDSLLYRTNVMTSYAGFQRLRNGFNEDLQRNLSEEMGTFLSGYSSCFAWGYFSGWQAMRKGKISV